MPLYPTIFVTLQSYFSITEAGGNDDLFFTF
ncbi:unknown [Bacteroides sp. CAG:633]|nr:unknown [Bacteroides sp. CAG:633]